MTLEELIDIMQRRIDRINKVGERTGETYWESEIYILKYLKELKTLQEEHEKNLKELEALRKMLRRYSVCTYSCPYLKTSVILDSLYITSCKIQKGCPEVTIGVTQCPYITESEEQNDSN